LRHISGAFRSTPISACRVLAHQPSVFISLQKLSASYANHLLKIPLNSLVSQRLPNNWRSGAKGSGPFPTLPRLPHNAQTSRYLSPIEHLASLSDPKAERVFPFSQWNEPGRDNLTSNPRFSRSIEPPLPGNIPGLVKSINTLLRTSSDSQHLYFSDGSFGEEGAGIGIVHGWMGGIGRSLNSFGETGFPWSPNSTAYDVEMAGLAIVAFKIFELIHDSHENDRNITDIFIYSDSTSALCNITDLGPHPGQIFSIFFTQYIELALGGAIHFPNIRIHLGWSPGHAEVLGNEAADRMARHGANIPNILPNYPSPPSYPSIAHLKAETKRKTAERFSSSIKGSKGTAFTDYYKPNPTPSRIFRSTPRELYGRVTQVLSGHGYIGEYFARMNVPESPWCVCSTSAGAPILHTTHHVLQHCSRYNSSRHFLTDNISNFSEPDWRVASQRKRYLR
jgi:hypothetical protein